MPEGRKKKVYTLEDIGGVTPQPITPPNFFNPDFSSPRQKSLAEMFPEVTQLTPIQGFPEKENVSFKTPEDIKRDELKLKQKPFGERAAIDVENFLSNINLTNSSAGDFLRQILPPIQSAGLRFRSGITDLLTGGYTQKLEGLGNTALGLVGGAFGTVTTPFTAIKAATEKVAGETAGKVAEVGTLGLAGGLPLVVGYLSSQGATTLADKIAKGLELTPKETETVQEVAGLTAFILGDKSARSFGKKVNTELGKKVNKYLDEILPDKSDIGKFLLNKREMGYDDVSDVGAYKDLLKKQDQQRIINDLPERKTYNDLLKKQDQQRIINNPPEKRPYQEPTEVLPSIELIKETPSALIFNESQIRDRIKEIDNEVRKAEKEGNESLYNELQAEKKRWQDQLPEVKTKEVKTPEIIKPNEEPVSKREQQKTTLYDENKKVINKILDENKGLLTEREISSKLNNLIEEGKLKKKVSLESIKKIKQEWIDAQPKPQKRVIKATPNELGLKIPNEYNDKKVIMYDKSSGVTLKEYTEEHPEIKDKIKDLDTFEEVKNVIVKDHYDRRHKVAIEVQEGIKKAKEKLAETTPNVETPEVKPVTPETKIEKMPKESVSKSVSTPVSLTPKLTPETKVEKQPYELKKNDFINEELARQYEKETGKKPTEAELDKWMFRRQEMIGQIDDYHYLVTKEAVEQGKPVPPEVLKDYPDLAKIEKPTETTPKVETPEVKPIDKNAPARELLEQTKEEKLIPDSVWDEIFGKPQTREQILEELNRAKKKGLNKLGSGLGAVDVDIIKGYVKLGALNLKEGIKDFNEWSKKMIENTGDEIRPYLREIYNGLQRETKTEDKPIIEWIERYKDNLGLTLEKINGKIIDPRTGQEGAARHKAGRKTSTIEFNDNTQGDTWYHELAHAINNRIRQIDPDFLNKYKSDIDKLAPSNRPINERFADAFTRIYTDPRAPRTALAEVLKKQFSDLPTSFELARRSNKELGYETFTREAGEKAEHDKEWLDKKYDAPEGFTDEAVKILDSETYKALRDDGTKTFKETLAESEKYNNITKDYLLSLDPQFVMEKPFNAAQQMRIERIWLNEVSELTDLSRTLENNLSRENALEFRKKTQDAIILRAIYDNNGRELARALQSRTARNVLSPEEYQLIQDGIERTNKLLGGQTGNPLSKVEKIKRMQKLFNPIIKDILQYGWYNLALSNPLTDMANIGGNLSSLGYVMLAHPISGTKAFKKAFLKEGLSWQNALKILRGEQHTISKYLETADNKREIINPKSLVGNIAKNIILPTERLKVEDAIFRTFFEELAKDKTAKIRAKELNVDKKQVLQVYADLINNKSSVNELVTTWGDKDFIKDVEGLERWASKMVFQEPLGRIGRPIQGVLNAAFPLNLLTIPFLRIAVNMGKLGLEASPYGLSKLLGREVKKYFGRDIKDMSTFEKKDLLQRATIGTMFYVSLMALLQDNSFELTGDAPKDKATRELWEKAGYRENSFVKHNQDGTKTLISYNNITPFNVILGGIGTLMTKAKYGKAGDQSVLADALGISLGMASSLGNQSFLQRTSTLLNIINDGDETKLEGFLMQATPAPNILGLTKGSADLESIGIGEAPKIYETNKYIDVLKNRYGITEGLTPKSDVAGEDKRSTYQRFPFPTKVKTDKIAEFMLQNGLRINDPDKPKVGGKEIFTDEEYSRFNKLYRRNFWKLMNQNFESLQRLTQNEEYGKIILEKIVSQLKDNARELAKQSVRRNK